MHHTSHSQTVFVVQVGSLAWQIVQSMASSSSLELSESVRNRAGNWRCRLGREKLGSLLESCSPEEDAESELESKFTVGSSSLGRAIGLAAGRPEPFFSFLVFSFSTALRFLTSSFSTAFFFLASSLSAFLRLLASSFSSLLRFRSSFFLFLQPLLFSSFPPP